MKAVIFHPNGEFWLKGKGSLNWACFQTSRQTDSIRVIALTGAASYIDDDLPKDEARTVWKRLRSKGWSPVVPDKKEMNVRKLTMIVHD